MSGVRSDDENAAAFGDDDDGLFDDDDFDWVEAMCTMGRDGQCGQAGSEHCDFECPNMRAWRKSKNP